MLKLCFCLCRQFSRKECVCLWASLCESCVMALQFETSVRWWHFISNPRDKGRCNLAVFRPEVPVVSLLGLLYTFKICFGWSSHKYAVETRFHLALMCTTFNHCLVLSKRRSLNVSSLHQPVCVILVLFMRLIFRFLGILKYIYFKYLYLALFIFQS